MTGQGGGFRNPGVCLPAFPSFLPHPLPALLLTPFSARSLTLVPRSLLLNRTETLATQPTCESSGKNIICSIEVKSPQQHNLPVRKKRIRANGMLTWDKTKRHASLTTSLISIAENLHFALQAKKRRFHEEGFRDTRVSLVPKIWGWVTESIITTYLFFSKPVSGRNPPNPAIWLVPRAGGFLRSCPLTRAESLAASFTSLFVVCEWAKPVIFNHFSFKTCAIISIS